MDDLISDFIAETREMLESIGAALLAWEAEPADITRLDAIFRFVHTVKGSCGFLNLARIEALAHAAETVLGALRSGTRQPDARLVGALLRVIDRIALLVDALDTDAEFPPVEGDQDIISALDKPDAAIAMPVDDHSASPTMRARNVRVSVDLLDTMMSEVSDLVLVRNELARFVKTARGDTPVEFALQRLSACVGDLRDTIARVRMQPVERLFAALPRLVRDTAASLGKTVDLVIAGSDVELDREMVEQLRDPLVHMVRNAIDHGIETPAERLAEGKPVRACVRVTACQNGNQIVIMIEDDGRGLDIARLRTRAIEAGLFDPRAAALLDDQALAQLVFAPGISTAAAVTAISGRGVGMDIVRAQVERLGGAITLDNRPGQGLTIEIRAPLTLSIVTVLSITAGGQVFAIPHGLIDEVFALGNGCVRIETVGTGHIATVRDESLPVVVLGALVEDEADAPTHLVVIDGGHGQRWALATGAIGDYQEVVVRPVAPIVAMAGLFAGQALPDDGRPLLVLDMMGVARLACIDSAARPQRLDTPVAEAQVALVTFATLSGERRAVRAGLVDRIADMPRHCLTAVGEQMVVTDDGAIYPVIVEGAMPTEGTVPMLSLSDGGARIGLAVSGACDLVRIPAAAITAVHGGEVAMIAGEAIPVVDGHALFAATIPMASGGDRTVAIVGGDPRWINAILAPLITAAGYRIAAVSAAADMILCCDARDYRPDGAQRVVRIAGGGGAPVADAVDRYDRAAILEALRSCR